MVKPLSSVTTPRLSVKNVIGNHVMGVAKMKVYVVVSEYPHEGETVLSVWSTADLADAEVDRLALENTVRGRYYSWYDFDVQ